MRLALLSLLLPIASASLSAPADARPRSAPAPQLCRPGPEVDENSPGAIRLRLTRTASCPYDLAALYRRIRRLFTAAPDSLRVETIEHLFGLPAMRTAYDSERIADYTTILRGAGGWELRIWVREAYYPLDRRRRPRFVPGPRPRRLGDIRDATVMIGFLLTAPRNPTPGASGCLSVAAALAIAARAGWQDRSLDYDVVDGPAPRYPYFRRGRTRFGVRFPIRGLSPEPDEMAAACVTELDFDQEPRGR